MIPVRVATSERDVDDDEYDDDSEVYPHPHGNGLVRHGVGYIRGLFCGTGSSPSPRSILCMMSIVIFLLIITVYSSFFIAQKFMRGPSYSVWFLLALVLPSVFLLFGLFYLCRTYFATTLDRSYSSLYSSRSLPYIHRPIRSTHNANSRQNMSLHMAALTVRVMSHMLERADGDPEALERLALEGVTHERVRALRLLLTDRDFTNEDYDALLALEEIVASQPGEPGYSGATADQIDNLPTYTYTKASQTSKASGPMNMTAASSANDDYISVPMSNSPRNEVTARPTTSSRFAYKSPQYYSSSEVLNMDDDEALQLAISLSLSESTRTAASNSFSGQKTLSDNDERSIEMVELNRPTTSDFPTRHPEVNASDDSEQHGVDSNTCSICLDEYCNGDELRILPCLHSFHTHCIDSWLHRNATCPVCKLDINDPIWRATEQSTLDY